MKVTVVGKVHRQGTSKKTGKPYDFIQAHCLGQERGVEGNAVFQLMLDPQEYPFADIIIGAEYSAEYDRNGYLVSFLPVRKS